MFRAAYLVMLLVVLSLQGGCGSATPPLLQGSMRADQQTNPDANGRASPIVVRVYELRSPTAFSGAEFFSLYDKESETLGADLVGREEFTLSPAEAKPYKRQLQPDTKFIGVAAAFRDLENSRWRQVAAIPAKKESTITIGIEARAITVSVVPGGPSFFAKHSPFGSKEPGAAATKEAPAAKEGALPPKDSGASAKSFGSSLKEAGLPSKDLGLASKEVPLASKGTGPLSKESLLAQANDMVADLVSLNSSGKLTTEQTRQVAQLLPRALALRDEVGQVGGDPLQAPQLASTLLDLVKQVSALKSLVK